MTAFVPSSTDHISPLTVFQYEADLSVQAPSAAKGTHEAVSHRKRTSRDIAFIARLFRSLP
jgi:hypothetical protein